MTTPDAAEVFDLLQEGLATRLQVRSEDITATTRLAEDLGVDSVTAVELLIDIEDSFGVIVTDEEAAHLSTVGQVAEFIAAAHRA
jgi:acyl carrier protein